jgi:hypothetical protein
MVNGVLYRTNVFSRRPQACGYPVRHLAFTDKGVGSGGESCLLAGVQLADKDDDDGGRTGCPQLIQGVAGVYSVAACFASRNSCQASLKTAMYPGSVG